jgi:predicted ester cyclase
MTFSGTHDGQLMGPTGPVPPTGNQVSLGAALFFHVQDGSIVRITRYGDTLSLLTQVGLRPAFKPA